jgi:short-subunit dehydrogenase
VESEKLRLPHLLKLINVALLGRSPEKLSQVESKISSFQVQTKAYCLDLADISVVRPKVEAIASEFGPIDILVNNAGIGYTNYLRETPLEDWQKILNLNLTSVFQCVMGVLPAMRERGEGTIINVASLAAATPFPEWGAYAVSKAGLIALSQSLATEERGNGIRVTTISPGAVNTPIWDTDTVQADLNRASMLTPEVVAQTILQAAILPATAVIESLTITPSLGVL